MSKENKELIHKSVWYFCIFSILGLIIETIYCYITTGVLESRKGLIWGPFCPVYGVGATILIITLNKYKNSPIKLFIYGVLMGSLIEYILSYSMEAIYKVRFWDYTYTNMHINGRICVPYSIMWGILSLILIKICKPIIDNLINKIKENIRNKLELIFIIFIIIDALFTFCAVTVYKERAINKYNGNNVENQENKIKTMLVNNDYMLKTFPNLRITGNNREEIWIRDILFNE